MKCRGLTYRPPRPSPFTLGPLDLEGPEDRTWLVLGPSGSGKTTLLRLLAGVLRPTAGSIEGVGGDLAYLPQLPERALAGRNLAEDLCGEVRPSPSVRAGLRSSLRRAGLEGVPLSRRSRDLSLGERRRVAIALLLHSGRRSWALDEPDAGLDRAGRGALLEILRTQSPSPGSSRWIATSRFELYAPLFPWGIVLDRGRVVGQGDLTDVLGSDGVGAALGLHERPAFRLREELTAWRNRGIPPGKQSDRWGQVQALLRDRTGVR